MMLSSPQLFKTRAREWAVRYAGAPSSLSSSAGGSSGGARGNTTAPAKKEYGGYDEGLVDRFTNMGFPVGMVVRALGGVGVKKRGALSDEEAERVVEALLS